MSVYPFSLLAIEALSGLRKSLTKSQISASGFKSPLRASNQSSLYQICLTDLEKNHFSSVQPPNWPCAILLGSGIFRSLLSPSYTQSLSTSRFNFHSLPHPAYKRTHSQNNSSLLTHTKPTHIHTHRMYFLSTTTDAFSAKKKVKQGPKMCHRCNLFRCIISGYKAITIWRY